MKTPAFRLRGALPLVATLLLAGGCAAKQSPVSTPSGATGLPASQTAGRTASVPNTPTATNINISEEILRACNIPDADAYFAFDSSHVTRSDHSPLNALATCFSRGPLAGRHMRLVGHSDPRGASEYNVTLGQSRADSVASYLGREGVGRGATSTTSRGSLDATGMDESGWAHDRRVDVLLAN
ncbi:MAG TPA: OmpA family protein [Polyangiaceae bacterium]